MGMFFRNAGRAYSGRHGPDSFSTVARFAFVAGIMTLAVAAFLLTQQSPEKLRNVVSKIPHVAASPDAEQDEARAAYDKITHNISADHLHPIDRLITEARQAHEQLLTKQSHNVGSAAQRYRERRGRHPPPGFDKWMAYAVDNDAFVVEEFFDRIYHDLNPFWGLAPDHVASLAQSWHHVVRVRNGEATGVGDTTGRVAWLQLWTDLVAEAAPFLPDVDMPINYMDESRLLVPWENITAYVAAGERNKTMPPAETTIQQYSGLALLDESINTTTTAASKAYDAWIDQNSPQYWNLSRMACAPDSPSRNVVALSDFSQPPSIPFQRDAAYATDGYVRNFTASADSCTQPHLRALHGTFIEPVSLSTATELIPLFGGSKLLTNNEILIPGAMYLTDDPFYSGGKGHGPPWAEKTTGVVWRGVASGGRNKKENWSHFQRHRLVEMLNGTTVSRVENGGARAMTFEMAPRDLYDYERRRSGTVGQFLSEMADAGFTDLLCFPKKKEAADANSEAETEANADVCDYVAPHLAQVAGKPMAEQYAVKFIPDADGNSFSARFRGLLLSTSLPLKATIYAEWHDARLQPWLHFAPLDNTFQDLHAVLDYLTSTAQGDAAARLMASTGKRWGEQVLRRSDMLLYVWRLLLEFARICDENRLQLGYVEDLLPKAAA